MASISSSTEIQQEPQNGAPDPDFQDCDSEALEMLEDEADVEEQDEAELDRLVDEAGLDFPEEKVASMLKELRRDGLLAFMRTYINPQLNIQRLLVALGILLPKALRGPETSRPLLLAILKTALHRFLQRRQKLEQYNTLEDALQLLRSSQSTIVLSGAGISTSCGIPDFRSQDGLYARLQESGQHDLDDPQDLFSKDVFLYRPELFYSFARDIYPSNFVPSPSHRFIKLLEDRGALLRNYTQNIDTLEQAVGIKKVLNCHGSFATASCVTCAYKTAGAAIKEHIFAQRVPACPECSRRLNKANAGSKRKRNARPVDGSDTDEDDTDGTQRAGILKPDITFFGEKLSDEFDRCLLEDRGRASLLVVMGTSLKVAPVSSVVGHLPHSCPVILINRTPVLHIGVDIMLLGDADLIVKWLCKKLGWHLPDPDPDKSIVGSDAAAMHTKESVPDEPVNQEFEPKRFGASHIWLFPGAEPGPHLEAFLSPDEPENDEDQDHSADEGELAAHKGDNLSAQLAGNTASSS
ncbi:unnamed protein product [Parajaminaea phylloscopi]